LSGVVELGEGKRWSRSSKRCSALMAVITKEEAHGYLAAVSEEPKNSRVVNARIGLHQQWMPLMEAKDLVKKSKGCYLRE
jgi:hypothetical protein